MNAPMKLRVAAGSLALSAALTLAACGARDAEPRGAGHAGPRSGEGNGGAREPSLVRPEMPGGVDAGAALASDASLPPEGTATVAETAMAEEAFRFLPAEWPGLTFVARYCGRALSFSKGVRKVGAPGAITASTPMRLSSNSKAFTALAVLRLASRGKLDLGATLGELFTPAAAAAPGVAAREGTPVVIPATPENERLRAVRLLDLLQMQSGIAESSPGSERCAGYWTWVSTYTDYDVLRGLVRASSSSPQHLDGDRGAHRYCNANYAILAVVAERVAGQPFEAHVKRITDELGMTQTGIIDFATPSTSTLPRQAEKVTGHVATRAPGGAIAGRAGYALRTTQADDQEDVGVVGDGEVWSTGEDMLTWLDYWMAPRAAGDDDPVLGRAVFDARPGPSLGTVRALAAGEPAPAGFIHLKAAAFEATGSANAGYALGWQRYGDYYELGKGDLVAHGGATEGFRSAVELYPYPAAATERAGFAVLTNYHFEDLPTGAPENREQMKAAEELFTRLARGCAAR